MAFRMFTQLLFSSTFTASIFLEMKVLPSSSSRRFKTVFLYFVNAWKRQLAAMEWITTITGMFIHYHLHFQCGLQSASSLPGNFGMYLFDIFAYFYQSTSVTEPKLHFSHVLVPISCSPGGCKHLCSYVTAHDCESTRGREAAAPRQGDLANTSHQNTKNFMQEEGFVAGSFPPGSVPHTI